MNRRYHFALALAVLLIGSRDGFAQTKPAAPQRPRAAAPARPLPRGYVLIGGAYLLAQKDFEDSATLRTNVEDGTYRVSYGVAGAPGFDGSAGVRIWKSFGLHVSGGRSSTTTAATLTANLPHPFFFNRPRALEADVDGLKREETAIGVHALAMFQAGRRVQLGIFAGPTFLTVKQGTVRSFTVTETYPYDSIAFDRAVTDAGSVSKTAFGGGIDVNYFVTKSIGIGASFKVAQADVDVAGANGASKTVKSGGPSIGIGVAIKIP